MLEIIITACLAAAPAQCHDERIKVLDEDMTLLQCVMSPRVQIDVGAWREAHPEFQIQSWHCRPYLPEKDA